ncbi:hypothetical protein ACTQ4K_00320 [Clostridium sporogenes]|uniref:hypothetical protein n=1 Tax=Clostridium sporogenes TaxID=1509 RepID=UPI003F8E10F2
MKNIRNLIGSKLIDVEVNANGFMVLYFQDEKGNVHSVDLCPTVSNLEEEVAPEVPVREQRIKNKLNKVLIYVLILSILQLSSTIFSVLYAKKQKAYLQDYYKNLQEIKIINKNQ